MSDIGAIIKQGLGLLDNAALQSSLMEVYSTPVAMRVLNSAQRTFSRLTATNHSVRSLNRFLAGWRAMHGTAIFVSGLIVRILREVEGSATPQGSTALLHAASQLGEIIREDVGLEGPPHSNLFEDFATYITGADVWKIAQCKVSACEEFRGYLSTARLNAPLEVAILTTAAAENWNCGEYNYLDRLIRPWVSDTLRLPQIAAEASVRYVSVHSGETELGHFLHAMKAWDLYCESKCRVPDPETARGVFVEYLVQLSKAFNALEGELDEE